MTRTSTKTPKLEELVLENNRLLLDLVGKHTTLTEEVGELKHQINLLPTKDEYFTKMDAIAGQFKNFSEQTPIIEDQLSNHEDRLQVVETKLNLSV